MDCRSTGKSDEQWREVLAPQRYRVLRQQLRLFQLVRHESGPVWPETLRDKKSGSAGWEILRDDCGELLLQFEDTTYICVRCSAALFAPWHKDDTARLWPTFPQNIQANFLYPDNPLGGMRRFKAICARCQKNLGTLFDDIAGPSELRLLTWRVSRR